ncbi:MAG: hypothetical protein ACRC0X_02765 [Brevinema sp.]
MKDLIVLFVISPILIIGIKNIWNLIRSGKTCGTCSRCNKDTSCSK